MDAPLLFLRPFAISKIKELKKKQIPSQKTFESSEIYFFFFYLPFTNGLFQTNQNYFGVRPRPSIPKAIEGS
jgi:hypothetical protein